MLSVRVGVFNSSANNVIGLLSLDEDLSSHYPMHGLFVTYRILIFPCPNEEFYIKRSLVGCGPSDQMPPQPAAISNKHSTLD